jgi:hypothetical protein
MQPTVKPPRYEWAPYVPGETPPKPQPCPFHEGHVWPCAPCLAWLAHDPDQVIS